MNRKMLVFAALIAVALLAAVLTWPRRDLPDHARPRTVPSPPTASPGPAWPPATANEVDRLLPFPRTQITEAARLAERFTAAYTSHQAGETPRHYAQRLTPMTAPALLPLLEQSAKVPAAPARARRQETVGQARVEAIRTLGPTSIIFVVTATTRTGPPATTQPTARPTSLDPAQRPGGQHVPAPGQERVRYAITTVRVQGRLLVYAIEPATSGDWGESGDRP